MRSTEPKKNLRINNNLRRMDIYYADLRGGNAGSEQTGQRPVLIIQNDTGNQYSPTTIVLAFSTSETKAKLPTHVLFKSEETGLPEDSLLLCEVIKTIDEYRLIEKVGSIPKEREREIDKALLISIGLDKYFK